MYFAECVDKVDFIVRMYFAEYVDMVYPLSVCISQSVSTRLTVACTVSLRVPAVTNIGPKTTAPTTAASAKVTSCYGIRTIRRGSVTSEMVTSRRGHYLWSPERYRHAM